MLKLFRIAVWLRAINDQRHGRILVLPEAALRLEMPSAHGAHSDCGPPARDGEGGHPPATATIETVPTRCAVTTPCESTLAMLGFELAHAKVTRLVMSLPDPSNAWARNDAELPTVMVVSAG